MRFRSLTAAALALVIFSMTWSEISAEKRPATVTRVAVATSSRIVLRSGLRRGDEFRRVRGVRLPVLFLALASELSADFRIVAIEATNDSRQQTHDTGSRRTPRGPPSASPVSL